MFIILLVRLGKLILFKWLTNWFLGHPTLQTVLGSSTMTTPTTILLDYAHFQIHNQFSNFYTDNYLRVTHQYNYCHLTAVNWSIGVNPVPCDWLHCHIRWLPTDGPVTVSLNEDISLLHRHKADWDRCCHLVVTVQHVCWLDGISRDQKHFKHTDSDLL